MPHSLKYKLSIVIAVLNDDVELRHTVQSVRDTAANESVEIVIIDDGSDVAVTIKDDPRVRARVFRNQQRYGCGAARHLGAIYSESDNILICDSHMRFEPGWFSKAIKALEESPQTVFCGSCMGLGEGEMEIIDQPVKRRAFDVGFGRVCIWQNERVIREAGFDEKGGSFRQVHGDKRFLIPNDENVGIPAVGTYSGATLNLCGKDPNNASLSQVLEGVWKEHKDGETPEIACLMGACYFINRELFFKLGGLKSLRMWGSDEIWISLAAWLSGHEVRLLRTVRIGHKFRTAIPGTNPPQYHAPYKTELWTGVYNKIRTIMTLLSKEEATFLISKLKEHTDAQVFARAVVEIRKDMVSIIDDEMQAKAKFKHDLRWYCDKFGIKYPALPLSKFDPALPSMSCMCLTYGRPERLAESIEFFLRQDYAGKRELIIFSDCIEQELVLGDTRGRLNENCQIKIINSPVRLGSMGDCRNECAKHCTGEILVLWDDDDGQLPGYLSLMEKAIKGHGLACHKNVFNANNFRIVSITEGSGNWTAFRRDLFEKVGGYSSMNSGDDQDIKYKIGQVGSVHCYECQPEEIQFIYGWNNGVYHMSGLGSDQPGQLAGKTRMEQHIEKQMETGKIAKGRIVVTPAWERDWVAMARDFVSNLQVKV